MVCALALFAASWSSSYAVNNIGSRNSFFDSGDIKVDGSAPLIASTVFAAFGIESFMPFRTSIAMNPWGDTVTPPTSTSTKSLKEVVSSSSVEVSSREDDRGICRTDRAARNTLRDSTRG